MTALPQARSQARSQARAQVGGVVGGGAAPFDPANISGMLSRFLDVTPSYHGSTLGGLPILTAEETGTLALPHGQHCLSFDGVNDFATRGAPITVGAISALTISAWIKPTDFTASMVIAAQNRASINQASFNLFTNITTGRLRFQGSGNGSTTFIYEANTALTANTWSHVAVVYNGGAPSLYINGVSVATTLVSGSVTSTLFASSEPFSLGAQGVSNGTGATFFKGLMCNVRVCSVAKTAGEVLAIANQHLTPTTIDTAGLIGLWWLNEESGSIAYDSWGNNDLTLTNGPTWTTDSGVNYNPANWLGHSKMLSFDGVNDHAFSVPLPLDLATDWTISFRVGGDIALADLLCIGDATTTGFAIAYASNYVQLISTSAFPDNIVTVPSSAWRTLAVTKSGTTITVYVDGVASGSITRSPTASNEMLRLGQLRYSGTNYNRGVKSLTNIRIYTVCKSAGEVAAIHSGTNDTTSLLALYNDQYDESGNNYHLDLINGTGVVVVPRNEATPAQDALGNALTVVGLLKHPAATEVRCMTGDGSAAYIDLSSAWLPPTADFSFSFILNRNGLNLGDTFISQSTSGNSLIIYGQNDERINLYLNDGAFQLNVACNGTDWYLVQVSRVGNVFTHTARNLRTGARDTVTATLSFSVQAGNTILQRRNDGSWPSRASIADFKVTTGGVTKHLPLQEGPGSSNTNRDRYWVGSDGTSGVVSNADVNGTVANINANYCPYARSHCIEHGGGVAVNGAFIPGRIGSGLDALGNAKTIPAGEPSPYDLIYPNRWGAPELVNVGIASSTAWGKTTAVQATAPADTKYRNTTKGTKNLIYSSAKSGADKTNLETYVST